MPDTAQVVDLIATSDIAGLEKAVNDLMDYYTTSRIEAERDRIAAELSAPANEEK